jgi:hypothetical protein
VVDNLLVLRNGQQVGFGPADEMINAVRNLQVVTPSEQAQKDDAQEVQVKEATNDAPVIDPVATPATSAGNIQSTHSEIVENESASAGESSQQNPKASS